MPRHELLPILPTHMIRKKALCNVVNTSNILLTKDTKNRIKIVSTQYETVQLNVEEQRQLEFNKKLVCVIELY